jgi:hypothetical protein
MPPLRRGHLLSEAQAEWRLAEASGAFRSWLNEEPRSDDAENSGRSSKPLACAHPSEPLALADLCP